MKKKKNAPSQSDQRVLKEMNSIKWKVYDHQFDGKRLVTMLAAEFPDPLTAMAYAIFNQGLAKGSKMPAWFSTNVDARTREVAIRNKALVYQEKRYGFVYASGGHRLRCSRFKFLVDVLVQRGFDKADLKRLRG